MLRDRGDRPPRPCPCRPGCTPSSRPPGRARRGRQGGAPRRGRARPGRLAGGAGRDHRPRPAGAGGVPGPPEAREFLQRAPASRVAGESSTPSGTPWSATSPTARCCGPSGPTSTAGRRVDRGAGPRPAEGRAELLAYHYRAALSFARAAGTEPPGLAARALAALATPATGRRPRWLGDAARSWPGRGAEPGGTRPAVSCCSASAGPAAGRDDRRRGAHRGPRGPAGRGRAGGRGRGRDAAERAGLPAGAGRRP